MASAEATRAMSYREAMRAAIREAMTAVLWVLLIVV